MRAGGYFTIRLPRGRDTATEHELQAVVMIGGPGEGFAYVDDAAMALVALARTIASDPSVPVGVRRVAAGVCAELASDVPTERGRESGPVPPGRLHGPACDCGTCAERRRGG